MTSATEELRRLLDERGVPYVSDVTTAGEYQHTSWRDDDYREVYAIDFGERKLLFHGDLTPEQAIAATLGACSDSCNCTNGERTDLDAATLGRGTCVNMDGETDAEWFTCSECNTELRVHEPFDAFSIHYCPNCGRKVVDA